MEAHIYRRARLLGWLSIGALFVLIGGMGVGILIRHGALFVALGFLLSVALRQAALMTFVLLSPWREAHWRRSYVRGR